MNTFDPKKHVIKIKGKDYLPVSARLLWFREVHPHGKIETEIIELTPIVVVKATIKDEDGNIIATAHGTAELEADRVVWEGKAVEKAETSALGRAMSFGGFGTQFGSDEV